MTTEEAARILRQMYVQAPRGNKTLAVHLFGIKYGWEIRNSRLSPAEISKEAGVGRWEPTINDGIKLGTYVVLKEQQM